MIPCCSKGFVTLESFSPRPAAEKTLPCYVSFEKNIGDASRQLVWPVTERAGCRAAGVKRYVTVTLVRLRRADMGHCVVDSCRATLGLLTSSFAVVLFAQKGLSDGKRCELLSSAVVLIAWRLRESARLVILCGGLVCLRRVQSRERIRILILCGCFVCSTEGPVTGKRGPVTGKDTKSHLCGGFVCKYGKG